MPPAASPSGRKLDPGGVAAVAAGAGFKGEALRTAVAVSFAENASHDTAAQGDTTITDSTWGPSVGLWQIRSLKADRGTGRPRDADRLTDPAFNARSAFTISKSGTDWTPWTMFTNGRWRDQLDAADGAIQAYEDGRGAGAVRDFLSGNGPSLDIGGRITQAVNALTGNLFKAGINIGAVLLALLLLGLGVMILLHKPIRTATVGVAKAAGAVAPQGKVASVAGKAAKVL